MQSYIDIPDIVQVRGNRLLIRKYYEGVKTYVNKSDSQLKNEENLQRNKPSGFITRSIKSQMNKILYNWIESVKVNNKTTNENHKVYFSFITLTLPAKQFHTDKELHRIALNRFIITIKRKYKVVNYLWRAEKQKNGNLHYHIIVDRYIRYDLVRNVWNNIMNDIGYIALFTAKNGHDNPNSTDIHGIRKVKNLAAYVTKYVTKEEYLKPIEGRVWGCSDNLKKLKDPILIIDSNTYELIEQVTNDSKTKIITEDYCTILYNPQIQSLLEEYKYQFKSIQKQYLYNFKMIYNLPIHYKKRIDLYEKLKFDLNNSEPLGSASLRLAALPEFEFKI